jgi:L-lactate dehydrogenase complex protein LldG
VHVALVERAAIFADLPQAVAALGHDRNVIWCTGPSKTADVEGILIEGVHGPGVQIALIV